MTINEKLLMIQQKVKATKSEYNSFGKYSYRSAEGIIESIKPILADTKTFIVLSDDVRLVGDRIYVVASAMLCDVESDGKIVSNGFAREAKEKKGMDEAQITGAASSYARKYALSGLLLLDDNKDADTDEYQAASKTEPKKATSTPTPKTPVVPPCSECGNAITEFQGGSPDKIAKATIKKYGKPLCMTCASKYKALMDAQAKLQASEGQLPFEL